MFMRILLVEDDPSTARAIELMLTAASYNVFRTDMGEEGIDLAKLYDYDLILLDLDLPDMHGMEVLRHLRLARVDTPILILTGSDDTESKLRGFGFGADDYMTKPFSTRELVSRIKAVLRRANALSGEKTIDANGLILDPVSQRVSFGDNILEMGPTEYRLLAFFMTHPERAYTRAQLLDQVWGGNVYIEDRTIDVHIRRLRKVLEPYGVDRFVQTVRGTGYRFSTRADVALG